MEHERIFALFNRSKDFSIHFFFNIVEVFVQNLSPISNVPNICHLIHSFCDQYKLASQTLCSFFYETTIIHKPTYSTRIYPGHSEITQHLSLLTVMPTKNDSDLMFCLQNYKELRIDRSLVY